MGRIKTAVSDSGPLIHLAQLNSIRLLGIARHVRISEEVFNETCSSGLPGSKEIKSYKKIKIQHLDDKGKDFSKIIAEKYSLGIGESQSIALAMQERIKFLFTDDLSARTVAKAYGLAVHGTLGIILRAYRENMITKKRAVQTLLDLKGKSTLFITSDLIKYAIKEIEKFSRR